MWSILCVTAALAGEVVIDAHVPTDVFYGDAAIARLFVPSVLTVPLPSGRQSLRVWIGGDPHDIFVDVPEVGSTTVLVGKTGVTSNAAALPDGVIGPVEFRVTGKSPVLLVLDDIRYRLGPTDVLKLDLADGQHRLTVRDETGTVIWARGSFEVNDPRGVVVQVAEGNVPEVGGTGGAFLPDSH
jgi:hypothetical protein